MPDVWATVTEQEMRRVFLADIELPAQDAPPC